MPRFVAADFLPDYTSELPSLSEHPIIAERIKFRRELLAQSDVTGLHIHIGVLLEEVTIAVIIPSRPNYS